jgi:hypothetical protein
VGRWWGTKDFNFTCQDCGKITIIQVFFQNKEELKDYIEKYKVIISKEKI